ncbi:hypothetical protein T02_3961 [Trichinella nativa]|uniref:Uncharacterized protein n=1 Tax=Trichinella nativa TaxID=6335 RepID=A0A0V1KZ01_9BILA|nr:hypothetical protein T02_3961 [Trichinella nativa]
MDNKKDKDTFDSRRNNDKMVRGGVLFFADKGFDKNAFCNICTAIKASKLNGGTFRLGPALSNGDR